LLIDFLIRAVKEFSKKEKYLTVAEFKVFIMSPCPLKGNLGHRGLIYSHQY